MTIKNYTGSKRSCDRKTIYRGALSEESKAGGIQPAEALGLAKRTGHCWIER